MKNSKANAFPQPITPSGYELNVEASGMTKREYFAACAMHGLVAVTPDAYQTVADMAVKYADALLKELGEKP